MEVKLDGPNDKKWTVQKVLQGYTHLWIMNFILCFQDAVDAAYNDLQ